MMRDPRARERRRARGGRDRRRGRMESADNHLKRVMLCVGEYLPCLWYVPFNCAFLPIIISLKPRAGGGLAIGSNNIQTKANSFS